MYGTANLLILGTLTFCLVFWPLISVDGRLSCAKMNRYSYKVNFLVLVVAIFIKVVSAWHS